LRHPHCDGVGSLQVVATRALWDEAALPFGFFGGGVTCRIVPSKAFPKDALAASPDERLLVVDCPDAPGWLVPQEIVAEWMSRHVANPDLDDLLLGHPLYEHLTRLDDRGHSRSGRTPMVHWTPGVPTVARLRAPEFLPDDPEAPAINRTRAAYAAGVTDLLRRLEKQLGVESIEIGLLFQSGRARPSR
jgi:hypothetical protein